MKILIAADLYYPVINGVSTFSRNLAQGLASRGHEVLVIAPSQTGKPYKEIDGNYVIVRTATVIFPFYQNYRISLTPMREVKKAIDEFEPDIIHIQMLMWIGQATMKYGNKIGIPIVSTNHAMPENLMDNLKLLAPIARPINYMLRDYGRRFHSKSDYVTMPTKSAIGMFKVADKMTVPMKVISNGINLSQFTDEPADPAIYKKFSIPKDKPIVTYVGRLDAEKHLFVLIKAFARVLETVDAHLVIVGDGTDAENLRHMVHQLHITDKVTFTGRVSEEDKPELHRIGKVFVMPSPAELQSIATLEAMASGKPVVAVNAGALSELCQNNINGYLCELDDYEAFAKGLVKILTDDALQKKFSAASLKIARENDLDYTLDEFLKLYTQLIG